MRHLIAAGLVAALGMGCGAVEARDLALIVANQSYSDLPRARPDGSLERLRRSLEDAEFDILVLENANTRRLQQRFAQRRGDLEAADRLVIVLTGHLVTDGDTTWLLGTDARAPEAFGVGAAGLRLDALYPILGDKPGAAVLVAATLDAARVGAGLDYGYLPGDLPQGVTAVAGAKGPVIEMMIDDILEGGMSFGRAVEDRGGSVVGYGFLPRNMSFLPVSPEERSEADERTWFAADEEDTEAAYSDYLNRFPRGLFAIEAERRLAEKRMSPEALAESAEADLGLNRNARREIQRNLTILGYDTRGIDGLFGRGTRSALRSWQGDNGIEATGYLTGNQVARLREDAAERQARLEREATARQEEADRADSAYWRETGRGETEDGLRAYLARYPDGLFSEIARSNLNEIEAARRDQIASAERTAWDEARAEDDVAAYERYLAIYPGGAFADTAQARLTELRATATDQAALEKARQDEAGVLSNPITRLLVERRLQQLGLEPGAADGKFDEDTRKAIRNYQRARDLPVTGYVTQATLVRMLAG